MRRAGGVEFVFDVADDFLDQILDSDNPVRARKFIEHYRQMHMLLAHVRQNIERMQRAIPAELWAQLDD